MPKIKEELVLTADRETTATYIKAADELTAAIDAAAIAAEILDVGLGQSSWREAYPEAYRALLSYREDMTASAKHILTSKAKYVTTAEWPYIRKVK